MKKSIPISVFLAALCALPIVALANPHDDGNRHPDQSRQAAPVRQQQPQQYRQQQPQLYRQQQPQQYRQQQPQQYRQQQPQQYRQQQPQQYREQQPVYRSQPQQFRPQPVQPRNVQQMPRYQSRTVVNDTHVSYVSRRGGDNRAWDWNRGREWYAHPNYWGGGFWGAFSIGLAFNENNYNSVPYYAVQQSSPGAQLLQNYGLTQTTCDQPNLVDITGPDGGEICAYPNDEVSPGQYSVDPSTLTLISN